MKLRILFFFSVYLLFTTVVFADSMGQGANWNPVSIGPMTTWIAPVQAKGQLSVQPFVFYNRIRGEFDSQGHYTSLPKGNSQNQFQQQLFTEYGITDKLEIDAQTVYQENDVTQAGEKAHDHGFGDSFVYTRYQFLDDKGWVPTTTGLLQLKMPTGKYQHEDPNKLGTDLMGAAADSGSWSPGIGINLSKKLRPFMVYADLIGSFPQSVDINGNRTHYSNYINGDAAIEYFLPKGFNVMMELNNLSQGDKRVNGAMVPDSNVRSLSLAPGVGWSNDRIQMLIEYQRTMWGVNQFASDTMAITFTYAF